MKTEYEQVREILKKYNINPDNLAKSIQISSFGKVLRKKYKAFDLLKRLPKKRVIEPLF